MDSNVELRRSEVLAKRGNTKFSEIFILINH